MSIYTQAGFKDKLDYQTYCAGQAGCPVQYVVDGTVGIDNLQYIYDYAFTYSGGGAGPTPPPPPPSGTMLWKNVDYNIVSGNIYIGMYGDTTRTFTLPQINSGTPQGVMKYFINNGSANMVINTYAGQAFADGNTSVTIPPSGTFGCMPVANPTNTGYLWI